MILQCLVAYYTVLLHACHVAHNVLLHACHVAHTPAVYRLDAVYVFVSLELYWSAGTKYCSEYCSDLHRIIRRMPTKVGQRCFS